MNAPADIHPVPYSAAVEVPEDKEAETTFDLKDTMHGISLKTYQDSGHAIRSVHAKTHGLLTGEMTVLDGLPPAMRRLVSNARLRESIGEEQKTRR